MTRVALGNKKYMAHSGTERKHIVPVSPENGRSRLTILTRLMMLVFVGAMATPTLADADTRGTDKSDGHDNNHYLNVEGESLTGENTSGLSWSKGKAGIGYDNASGSDGPQGDASEIVPPPTETGPRVVTLPANTADAFPGLADVARAVASGEQGQDTIHGKQIGLVLIWNGTNVVDSNGKALFTDDDSVIGDEIASIIAGDDVPEGTSVRVALTLDSAIKTNSGEPEIVGYITVQQVETVATQGNPDTRITHLSWTDESGKVQTVDGLPIEGAENITSNLTLVNVAAYSEWLEGLGIDTSNLPPFVVLETLSDEEGNIGAYRIKNPQDHNTIYEESAGEVNANGINIRFLPSTAGNPVGVGNTSYQVVSPFNDRLRLEFGKDFLLIMLDPTTLNTDDRFAFTPIYIDGEIRWVATGQGYATTTQREVNLPNYGLNTKPAEDTDNTLTTDEKVTETDDTVGEGDQPETVENPEELGMSPWDPDSILFENHPGAIFSAWQEGGVKNEPITLPSGEIIRSWIKVNWLDSNNTIQRGIVPLMMTAINEETGESELLAADGSIFSNIFHEAAYIPMTLGLVYGIDDKIIEQLISNPAKIDSELNGKKFRISLANPNNSPITPDWLQGAFPEEFVNFSTEDLEYFQKTGDPNSISRFYYDDMPVLYYLSLIKQN